MRALTTGGRSKHIPFRDSKLTHLLRDSLGGNSKTTMVICMASDDENRDETMSTLRFGQRAKRIQCAASVNKSGGGMFELKEAVARLQAEVDRLSQENNELKLSKASGGDNQAMMSSGGAGTLTAELEAKTSECEAMSVRIDSTLHTLKEREATIMTLSVAKKEIQSYSEELLAQLNEAERRSTAAASLGATKDVRVEAARDAIAAEEERLQCWEAEMHAERVERERRWVEREEEMLKRMKMLEEREREAEQAEKAVVVIAGGGGGAAAADADADADASAAVTGETKSETTLREQLEEEFSVRSDEMERRVKEAEERVAAKEREIVMTTERLRSSRERNEEKSNMLERKEREMEAREREEKMSGGERLEEMSKKMTILETYRQESEHDKTGRDLKEHQMELVKVELEKRTATQQARISDLEGQLLSVYYAHQQAKEFEVEERREEEERKRRRQEQMKEDEELAALVQSRGSSGLEDHAQQMQQMQAQQPQQMQQMQMQMQQMQQMQQQQQQMQQQQQQAQQSGEEKRSNYDKVDSTQQQLAPPPPPPPPPPPRSFPHSLPLVTDAQVVHPTPPVSSSRSSPPPPSYAPPPSGGGQKKQMTDHEFALLLQEKERQEASASSSSSSSASYGTPVHARSASMATPNSTHSSHSSHSARSSPSSSIYGTPVHERSTSMMALPTSTATARNVQNPSPFRAMKEGQPVILNPPPKMFHRCKANLGMIRGQHQRYLIIHSQELVVMKPNRQQQQQNDRALDGSSSRSRSGSSVPCLFKTAYDLRGVRARVQRKIPSNVDVVDPNGKTTYSFETEEAAARFVQDVEMHLP